MVVMALTFPPDGGPAWAPKSASVVKLPLLDLGVD